jgi:hypothetical protein
MLAVRLCIPITNPFPWFGADPFGADPYVALWHVTMLCAVALAVAAVLSAWLAHSWPLTGVVLLLFLGAVVLTIASGSFGGVVCEAPGPVSQQALQADDTWPLLVTLAQFLAVTTISVFVVGSLFVISERRTPTHRESSEPAGAR